MERTKLLTVLVVILIAMNLGLIATFFFGPGPKGRDERRNRNLIIEKLHFDASQVAEYDKLILWHQSEIRKHDQRANSLKEQLYLQLLKDKPDDKAADSLIALLGENHKEIERIHFKHFADIKSICHESQLKDYFELSEQLAQMFSKPNAPKPGQ